MWKHLFLFFWVVGLHQQSAQSQTFLYASSVLGFSSEYNSTDPSCSNSWAACRALGEPDVFPIHGDSSKAWAPRSSDNQREFIQLGFSTPIKTDSIFIYETYNPGAIDTIYLRNAQTQTWEKVWEGTANAAPLVSRIFKVGFSETTFPADAIRIALNSPVVPGWNEIDAVQLYHTVRAQTSQYASSVLGFSSEYYSTDPSCSNSWAACRALGEPDVFPNHGDSSKAWAPRSSDNQREFIQLGFSTPVETDSIFIYETYNPGAIDTIYLRNAQTQTWEKVWEGTANAAPLVSRIFKVGFSETTFPADAIRIALNSPVVPGWNEIDAVQLYHSSMTLSLNAAEKNNINSQTTILYPNPSQGECKMLRSEPSYVTIFTILGETIFSRVVLPGETIRLPAGVYTARIFDGSNSIDQTLIIH